MATRKPISKKVRFEVFKRDSFKCQYCGKSAPDVILHIDHINPVSKGGGNDIMNLITSCAECNAGKSDKLLSDDSAISKQRAMLEELNERREQLEQMLAWREGLKGIDEMAYQAAENAWSEIVPGWAINDKGARTLRALINKFGLQTVLDSIKSAEKYLQTNLDGDFTQQSVEHAWQKVGAICRGVSMPEHKRELYYIRGILRNRLSYVNEHEAIKLLEQAYNAGVDLDELKDIAKTTKNWTAFRNEIYDAMED